MTLNHADEYLIWDYVEPITVTQVLPHAVDVATAVAKAHKHDVDRKEVQPSDGVYVEDLVLWLVPYALHNDRIKPGDKITDQTGKIYIVQSTVEPALEDCWDCTCLDLQIWSQLAQTVTLYVATVTIDSAGTNSISYDGGTAIAARIQPDIHSKATLNGRRKIYQNATMYVLNDVSLAVNDRITDHDGNNYQITGFRDIERIDGLQTVDLELR